MKTENYKKTPICKRNIGFKFKAGFIAFAVLNLGYSIGSTKMLISNKQAQQEIINKLNAKHQAEINNLINVIKGKQEENEDLTVVKNHYKNDAVSKQQALEKASKIIEKELGKEAQKTTKTTKKNTEESSVWAR